MTILSAIIKIIIAFASTNLDDLVVLTILFAQAKTAKDNRKIYLGQFLAIMTLLTASVIIAKIIGAFNFTHLNLLGIIPLLIGIYYIINDLVTKERPKHKNVHKNVDTISIISVFLITVANGSDNIGLYLPMIVQFNPIEIAITYLIFAILVFIWCWMGQKIVVIPPIEKFLKEKNDIIVPLVFILLGIYIIFF